MGLFICTFLAVSWFFIIGSIWIQNLYGLCTITIGCNQGSHTTICSVISFLIFFIRKDRSSFIILIIQFQVTAISFITKTVFLCFNLKGLCCSDFYVRGDFILANQYQS